MASIRITRVDLFPEGTTVTAYPLANWSMAARPPTGAPVGSSEGTAGTMTGGVALLTNLSANKQFVAYALVGGEHRYLQFATLEGPAVTVLADRGGQLDAINVDRVLYPEGAVSSGGTTFARGAFYLSGDYASGQKMRLRAVVATNDTAGPSDIVVRLKAVTAPTGGVGVVTATIGADVATVALGALAANSVVNAVSAEFDPPVAGLYLVLVDITGAAGANNSMVLRATVELLKR